MLSTQEQESQYSREHQQEYDSPVIPSILCAGPLQTKRQTYCKWDRDDESEQVQPLELLLAAEVRILCPADIIHEEEDRGNDECANRDDDVERYSPVREVVNGSADQWTKGQSGTFDAARYCHVRSSMTERRRLCDDAADLEALASVLSKTVVL